MAKAQIVAGTEGFIPQFRVFLQSPRGKLDQGVTTLTNPSDGPIPTNSVQHHTTFSSFSSSCVKVSTTLARQHSKGNRPPPSPCSGTVFRESFAPGRVAWLIFFAYFLICCCCCCGGPRSVVVFRPRVRTHTHCCNIFFSSLLYFLCEIDGRSRKASTRAGSSGKDVDFCFI